MNAQTESGMECPVPVELLDFRNFLFMGFKAVGLPNPTPRQYEIAQYLQWGPKRCQVSAFRGIGKSIELEFFVAWAIFLVYSAADQGVRPEYAVKSLSAGGKRAANFSGYVQGLCRDWDVLQHLFPQGDRRSAVWAWDANPSPTQDSPTLSAMGVGGQLTGGRSDLGCMDDVETPENSYSQTLREKLAEAVKEVDALLKPTEDEELIHRFPHLPLWVIKQICGRNIVLGTPQTEETIYTALVKRGYSKRIWPARFPSPDWMVANGHELAPKILEELQADPTLATGWGIDQKSGKPTDTRFSDMDLIEREVSYGRTGFMLQFMLDTSLSDADRFPLKLSDLVIMDLDKSIAPEKVVWNSSPENVWKDLPNVGFNGDRYFRPILVSESWQPYTGKVLAVDPAGRGKDETSYAVVGMLNSQLFLLEAGGFGPSSGYQDSVLSSLAEVAKRNQVTKIIVEANFGDGMFSELLKPHLRRLYPCGCEEVKHSIQKERRIADTLEPVMNQHRLIVDRQVVEMDQAVGMGLSEEAQLRYKLFYQISRLTRDKGALLHDDRLDALSIAVAHWVESMALDADAEIQYRKDEEMQREIDRALQLVWDKQPENHSPRWHQTLDAWADD